VGVRTECYSIKVLRDWNRCASSGMYSATPDDGTDPALTCYEIGRHAIDESLAGYCDRVRGDPALRRRSATVRDTPRVPVRPPQE